VLALLYFSKEIQVKEDLAAVEQKAIEIGFEKSKALSEKYKCNQFCFVACYPV